MALLIGVIVVYAYNIESFSIRREIKNGMIRPAAYLISNLLIQLPLLLIASIFAISVSGGALRPKLLCFKALGFKPLDDLKSGKKNLFQAFETNCSTIDKIITASDTTERLRHRQL